MIKMTVSFRHKFYHVFHGSCVSVSIRSAVDRCDVSIIQSRLTKLAGNAKYQQISPSVSSLKPALGFSSEFLAGQRESCYAGVFKFFGAKTINA